MKQKLLAALLIFISATAFAEQKIPKGEIAESVKSAYAAGQTHAVYVPSQYTADKKWPVLLCFDARGRGKIAVELFREAAERLGWIIISSNHSRSDGDGAQNLEVLKAMWSDSHRWFSVDERRFYATGFSGGARLAWGTGSIFPDSIAGVIGVGAGMHEERPPSKSTTFVWYGITGDKDFNYLEVSRLDRQLASLQIPRRVSHFDGLHDWPPKEYCSRALDWMELQAMKQNKRAKDDAWIRQLYDSRRKETEQLERSNQTLEAYRKYTHLQEDFEGLVDLGEIPAKAAQLATSEAVTNELKEQKKREEKEDKLQKAFLQTLDAFSVSSEIPSARKLKSDLNIARFQKEIKQKGEKSQEGLLLQRVLEGIYAQTSFYLPQFLFQRKSFDRALVSLTVASEIHPESPWIWYRLALAHVQDGDKEKTLENLQLAIDRGMTNRKWVDDERAFDSIRTDPAFQQLLTKIPPQ
jgi:predicted esterase